MYVTIRRYQASPRDVGEIVRRVQESLVPIVRRTPGFVSFNLLDVGGGALASVGVFEQKTGAIASTRMAADWIKRAGLSDKLPTPPVVIEGDVALTATVEPPERDLTAWG